MVSQADQPAYDSFPDDPDVELARAREASEVLLEVHRARLRSAMQALREAEANCADAVQVLDDVRSAVERCCDDLQRMALLVARARALTT